VAAFCGGNKAKEDCTNDNSVKNPSPQPLGAIDTSVMTQ